VIYYGQTKVKGLRRRHHYFHFSGQRYVNRISLAKEESLKSKLIQYFPVVRGLEGLPPIAQE
jgi:hypothetical protein